MSVLKIFSNKRIEYCISDVANPVKIALIKWNRFTAGDLQNVVYTILRTCEPMVRPNINKKINFFITFFKLLMISSCDITSIGWR